VERNPSFVEASANLGVALAAQGRLEEAAGHLRRAVNLRPDYAAAHRDLGEVYALQHRLGDAAAEYAQALRYRPDDVHLLNRLSWILATARDDGARDGARALAFARRAVELTRRQDADSLDSLAAALAEQGAFADAEAAAREAARLAAAKGNGQFAAALAHRAGLYSRGQRFRE
jgi:tetratricopeptide (TPR) repeat protein